MFRVPARTPKDLPASTIGDFRLIDPIGRGGMGEVYLAEQLSLKRLVALKLIRAGPLAGERARLRFQREAEVIGRLHHRAIVSIHAAGEAEGALYLAMEYLPGRSLQEVLEAAEPGKPIVHGDIVRWGHDVASALQAAHEAGIIHRDVKPSNIRIHDEGHAVLLDFGLARDLQGESLSTSGAFLGSPHYAAPEQITGTKAQIGPPTDVYSLGVTLYEGVTGQLPFNGETTEQVFHEILSREPIAPRKRSAQVSRDLETILLKAMEKDIDQRYQTAGELAEDLLALLQLRSIKARPPSLLIRCVKTARRNRTSLVASIVSGSLVLVLAGLAGFWGWRSLTLPDRIRALQRRAHLLLLDPMHEVRLANLRMGRAKENVRDDAQETVDVVDVYDELMQLAPGRLEFQIERHVVQLARSLRVGEDLSALEFLSLHCPATTSRARKWLHEPTAEADGVLRAATVQDRRALGLLAFLLGHVELCQQAWSGLDLNQDRDALLDAAAGQFFREFGQPELAYPRLLRALDDFGEVGYLAYSVADCACELGDLDAAEQYLRMAETFPLGDPWQRELCVRADLLAARGAVEQALKAYELARYLSPSARRHYARFLERLGSTEYLARAIDLYLEVVALEGPRQEHLAKLVALADRWWQGLAPRQRLSAVCDALGTPGVHPRLRWIHEALAQQSGPQKLALPWLRRDSSLVRLLAIQGWDRWPLTALEVEKVLLASCSLFLDQQCLLTSEPKSASWLRWLEPAIRCGAWLKALRAGGGSQGPNWTLRQTPSMASGPSPRQNFATAYDRGRGVTVLFGGYAAEEDLHDTWEWDGVQWLQMHPDHEPPLRSGHSMVYDISTQRVILHGGTTQEIIHSDMWLWDGHDWVSSSIATPARSYHSLAYDSHRQRIVLFGGQARDGPSDDTWEWDGTAWHLLDAKGPAARLGHVMTFDASRRVTVLFGGKGPAGLASDDTWEWDGSVWTRASTAIFPGARSYARMAYDSRCERVFLFGGVLRQPKANLWEWDGKAWWFVPRSGPSGRSCHELSYDSARECLVLFGGASEKGPVGDTWEISLSGYDPRRWRRVDR
jgi:tRNA A-37 threonylcarbamoyl transferase component Bud32